jgi:hypothetical protein
MLHNISGKGTSYSAIGRISDPARRAICLSGFVGGDLWISWRYADSGI